MNSIMHEVIMGQSEIGINIDLDNTWWEKILGIVAAIVVGIAIIALFIAAPGALAAVWTAIKAAATFLSTTGLSTIVAVGTVLYAASSILASRLYKQYVFTIIFVFGRRNI